MVTLEFEIEDLIGAQLLLKVDGKIKELKILETRKGLVKLCDLMDDDVQWVPEEEVEVVDILFR